MDDFFSFFDFSLPDFSLPDFNLSNLFSGAGDIFSMVGTDLEGQLPNIAQDLAKFALAKAFGGGSSGGLQQQLLGGFVNSAFSNTATSGSLVGQSDTYFQTSSGQSMAQLAAIILRAQRRFL